MLKFLHSLFQVGIVLIAQHSWRLSGLASVCLRVKNPQELLNDKPRSRNKDQIPEFQGGGGAGRQLTSAASISALPPRPRLCRTAARVSQAPLLPGEKQLRCWEDPGGPGSNEPELALLPVFLRGRQAFRRLFYSLPPTHTNTHTPLKSRLLESRPFQLLLPLSLQPAAAADRTTEMVPVPHCSPVYHGEGRTQVLRPLQVDSAALPGGSKNRKGEA